MSGIYIHIPFCKQACHYCDFHFSTNQQLLHPLIQSLLKEIELQKGYLEGERVETIYFGGGTPSILSSNQIGQILEKIDANFTVESEVEITLEANPDDYNKEKFLQLHELGINRLSLGIQSFNDKHLTFLNRAHSAEEATSALKSIQDLGFDNITIDLIYGIPHENHEIWLQDLALAISFETPHISSYNLTIEPNTVFGKWTEKGKLKSLDDEFGAAQYEIMITQLSEAGYEQYEISNFCKPPYYSKHNSSYWKGAKYLGIGPSAHSFNKISRSFNISNNPKYIKSLDNNVVPSETEHLSEKDIVNELLLTGIRTKWGVNLEELNSILKGWDQLNKEKLSALQNEGHLHIKNAQIYLTEKGKLLADEITLQLFVP